MEKINNHETTEKIQKKSVVASASEAIS